MWQSPYWVLSTKHFLENWSEIFTFKISSHAFFSKFHPMIFKHVPMIFKHVPIIFQSILVSKRFIISRDGSRVIWKGGSICLNVKFSALCGARNAQLLRGSADVTPGKFWKSRFKMVHSPEFWKIFPVEITNMKLEGVRGCHPRKFCEIYMWKGVFSCILSAYDHPETSRSFLLF